jgi:hypothetical protein
MPAALSFRAENVWLLLLVGCVVMPGPESWQHKVVFCVLSHKIEGFLLVLLIIDVFVVMIELFMSAEYPSCHIITRDAISCEYVDPGSNSSLSADLSSVCYPNFVSRAPPACDDGAHPIAHTLHVMLFTVSVTILICFLMELTALFVAVRPQLHRGADILRDLGGCGGGGGKVLTW